MKVIWQAVLDVNEMKADIEMIGQAVLDINESDCASGSGYK